MIIVDCPTCTIESMILAIAQLQLRRRLLGDYNEVWGYEGYECFWEHEGYNGFTGFESFEGKYLNFKCYYFWFCTLNDLQTFNTTYILVKFKYNILLKFYFE